MAKIEALIDADALIFRCGFATEKMRYTLYGIRKDGSRKNLGEFDSAKEADEEKASLQKRYVDFEREGEAIIEPVENCLYSIRNTIESICEAVRASSYTVYIGGKGNFREAIATMLPYKGNRDKDHRPFHEKKMREYLIKYHDAIVCDGQEADDVIGIRQCEDLKKTKKKSKKNIKQRSRTIICSPDKDMNTIPGWHYNWTKEGATPYWVTSTEARQMFYHQLLEGDSADNIKGLENVGVYMRNKYGIRKAKGCGAAAARTILEGLKTEKELYAQVLDAYKDWEITKISEARGLQAHKVYDLYGYAVEQIAKDKILENGQLLRIRRKPDELWRLPE